jgi:ribosomal protein L37AE/L43A
MIASSSSSDTIHEKSSEQNRQPESVQGLKKSVPPENLVQRKTVHSHKDVTSANYKDIIEGLAPVTGKHVPVRVKRARAEREMKGVSNMVREKKRRNTLRRASQPRTKHIRLETKKVTDPNTLSLQRPSVEATHASHIKTLNKEQRQVYTNNYDHFTMLRGDALFVAREKDKKVDQEEKAIDEKFEQLALAESHKKRMTASLVLIASSVPHASGAKLSPAPKRRRNGDNSLTAFFPRKKDFNVARCLREWKQVYYETVLPATGIIIEWPMNEDETSASNARDVKEVNRKNMQCNDCHVQYVINNKEALLVCPQCGITTNGGEGITYRQTFAEQQASSRGPAPYDRLAHVSWLFIYLFIYLVD